MKEKYYELPIKGRNLHREYLDSRFAIHGDFIRGMARINYHVFLKVIFSSITHWHFGLTNCLFFRLGSRSSLRYCSRSLQQYRLNHTFILYSNIPWDQTNKTSNFLTVLYPDIKILWHLDCLYRSTKKNNNFFNIETSSFIRTKYNLIKLEFRKYIIASAVYFMIRQKKPSKNLENKYESYQEYK